MTRPLKYTPMENQVEATELPSPAPVRIFKLGWGIVATAASVLYTFMVCAPSAAIAARMGSFQAASNISRAWGRLIIRMCGIKVEVEGLENLRGLKSYVLVSNHQSFFDIFAVLAYLPGDTRFVAKKELLKVPLVGYAMVTNGHIIVDRQGGGRSIRRALDAARNSYPVCIFAEGHRHNDGRVHDFEEGAAWLAIMSKLPCVPMAVSGSGAFFPREAKVVVPGGRMRIKVLAPIATEDLKSSDRKALTHQLEEAVRSAFSPDR
jgi:1-acyl-sn-glycerol-3-phosphate acyltransferase